MEVSPELLLKDVAFTLQRSGQNLASAIAYTELAKSLKNDASAWTGLGAALAKSGGTLTQKTFYEWSAKVFMRALEMAAGTPFQSPCQNWLGVIGETIDVSKLKPIGDEELEPLAAYLDIEPNSLGDGLAALEPDDQGKAIMAIGDIGGEHLVGAMLDAVKGRFGDFNVRAALKRLSKFGDTPAIRETLAEVAVSTRSEDFQPYLAAALNAVDKEWAGKFGRAGRIPGGV